MMQYIRSFTRELHYNITLAYPVIAGLLGHTLVAFVDNVMVGHLGTTELAGISLGNSYVFIAIALGIGFSFAITPLTAEADAQKDYQTGKNVLKHGVLISLILGVVLMIGIFLSQPLMNMMNQPNEVVILAEYYIPPVAISIIPMVIFQVLKQFSDGLSLTKYAMYATIVGNIINVIVNYFLIFGKGPFPKMGIEGAAIGTLISRLVMVMLLAFLFLKNRNFEPYVKGLNFFTLHLSTAKKIIKQGCPTALQVFFEVVFFTSAIWISGLLGKNPQAANQIILNLSSMTYMVAMGLATVAMIRVGNQKGKGNFIALRQVAFSVFLLIVVLDILFAILFISLRNWLPSIYLDEISLVNAIDNNEVTNIATKLLVISAFFQIFDGMQAVILGALRGMQDIFFPTIITFISYGLIGIPTCYLLSLVMELGTPGIWIGLLLGLLASSSILFIRFNHISLKLLKKI